VTHLVRPEPAVHQHVDLTPCDVGRTALLDAVVTLADRLRRQERAARALTVTVHLAGGSRLERTRTLPAPTGRPADLRAAAGALYDGLALRRAGMCGITVRVD
jgi:impB/mucB/samB family C-terminal domain